MSGSLANNSFLHVFVNVSSIKRFEKERATNKCLHIMFASISHEFRTPLNAFMNAVDLIQLNHNSAFELISENSKGKNESQIKRIFESTRGFLYSQLDQWIQLQNWSQVSFLIIPNMYMQSKGECIRIDVQKNLNLLKKFSTVRSLKEPVIGHQIMILKAKEVTGSGQKEYLRDM